MKRDPCSFLADVIEAGTAILEAVKGISLDEYGQSRLIRSSVEREFIIIGEGLIQLGYQDQLLLAEIELAPEIIRLSNRLTHEYTKINDTLVWGVIETKLPPLIQRCRQVLDQREQEQS
jgi:uncharacterized protein with HEPN domain